MDVKTLSGAFNYLLLEIVVNASAMEMALKMEV